MKRDEEKRAYSWLFEMKSWESNPTVKISDILRCSASKKFLLAGFPFLIHVCMKHPSAVCMWNEMQLKCRKFIIVSFLSHTWALLDMAQEA